MWKRLSPSTKRACRSLRNRLNAEIFFFKPDKPTIVATHEDLSLYKVETFLPHLKEDGFFEINIRGNPYRLMLRELKWGDTTFVMGLGASKSAAMAVLKNVNVAFFTVVGAIIVLADFAQRVRVKDPADADL